MKRRRSPLELWGTSDRNALGGGGGFRAEHRDYRFFLPFLPFFGTEFLLAR